MSVRRMKGIEFASKVPGRRTLSQLVVLGIVALLGTALAWAGDPWKDKAFQQWDAKDCQKIMFNSPWAEIIEIDATWRTPTAGSTQDLSRGSTDKAVGTMAGPGATGMAGRPVYGGQGAGGGTGNSPGAGPTAQFVIRWVSSEIERQAAVRNAILSGRMKEDAAQTVLSEKPAEYQVMVAGPDMGPFEKLEEKDLMAAANLQPKKTKEKVAPTRVQIERDPDSKRVAGVVFLFPKQKLGGESVVGADEKSVEFTCVLGIVTLKKSFDLKQMVIKQGRDL